MGNHTIHVTTRRVHTAMPPRRTLAAVVFIAAVAILAASRLTVSTYTPPHTNPNQAMFNLLSIYKRYTHTVQSRPHTMHTVVVRQTSCTIDKIILYKILLDYAITIHHAEAILTYRKRRLQSYIPPPPDVTNMVAISWKKLAPLLNKHVDEPLSQWEERLHTCLQKMVNPQGNPIASLQRMAADVARMIQSMSKPLYHQVGLKNLCTMVRVGHFSPLTHLHILPPTPNSMLSTIW